MISILFLNRDGCVSDSEQSSDGSGIIIYPVLKKKETPIGIQRSSNEKWNKLHTCTFCNKYVIKLFRHIETVEILKGRSWSQIKH